MSETCGKKCACAAAAAASSETKSSDTKTEAKKTEAPKAAGFRNGKGSAPRNISAKFRSNFDTIKWS